MEAAGRLLEEAIEVDWYEEYGTDVDRAALALCRVRRGYAGQRGGPQHGDEAVRVLLERASPEATIWIASRAISYLDENGFPEAVAPWIPEAEQCARSESALADSDRAEANPFMSTHSGCCGVRQSGAFNA